MNTQVRLTAAIEEYLIAKRAEGLSHHTLYEYRETFQKTVTFMPDDPYLDEIAPIRIQKLLNEYDHLSKKTRRNMCVGLSSLFEYHLKQENVSENIMRRFRWPKPDVLSPDPLSDSDIEKLFQVLPVLSWERPDTDLIYQSPARHIHRNRAILLMMLDTGIRSGELCGLKVINLSPDQIKVFGKGSKERKIPISELTYKAVLRYWGDERTETPTTGTVFVNEAGKPFRPDGLHEVLRRIGVRAKVHLHPHRMRHTFAISFLRNQGNIYVLQKILGHTTLDMVKRYLKLAESDISEAHRLATPLIRLNFDPLSLN